MDVYSSVILARKSRGKKLPSSPGKNPGEMLLDAIGNPTRCFVCLNTGMVSTGAKQCGKPDAPEIRCPKCFPKEYGL